MTILLMVGIPSKYLEYLLTVKRVSKETELELINLMWIGIDHV